MRPVLPALMLMLGVMAMADLAFATVYGAGRIYVPGHIRDGFYIRPHFVSTPKLDHRAWPAEPGVIEPKVPPRLPERVPGPDSSKLGEPS